MTKLAAILTPLLILALAFAMIGCGAEESPTPTPNPGPNADRPTNPRAHHSFRHSHTDSLTYSRAHPCADAEHRPSLSIPRHSATEWRGRT
jgi:hypothetical protein